MVHLSLECVRCRAAKPLVEFQPVVFDSVILRSDTCAACCREINHLRRTPREVLRKGGANDHAQ